MRGKIMIGVLLSALTFFIFQSGFAFDGKGNTLKAQKPSEVSPHPNPTTIEQKSPAALMSQDTNAPLKMKEAPSNEPVIESVSELKPGLEAGGREVELMLKGKNLDKLTSGQVMMMSNLPAKDIDVKLGPPSATMRKVMLKASEKAQTGSNYKLKFIAGAQMIDVPVTKANISVEKLKDAVKIKDAMPSKETVDGAAKSVSKNVQRDNRRVTRTDFEEVPRSAAGVSKESVTGPGKTINPKKDNTYGNPSNVSSGSQNSSEMGGAGKKKTFDSGYPAGRSRPIHSVTQDNNVPMGQQDSTVHSGNQVGGGPQSGSEMTVDNSPPKFVPGQNGQPDSYQWGDGRQVVANGGGGKGKVQSDGSIQYPDGTVVYHKQGDHSIVIQHPDGTTDVSYMPGGPKLNKSAEGDEVYEFPNGAKVPANDPSGRRGTVTPNGHVVYGDGTEAYGSGSDLHVVYPDGREVIHHDDGSVTVHDAQSGADIEFGDQGDSDYSSQDDPVEKEYTESGVTRRDRNTGGRFILDYKTGTTIQFGNHGKPTHEVGKPKNDTAIVRPDGSVEVHHPDGSVTVHDPQTGATIEFGDQGDSTFGESSPKPDSSDSGTSSSDSDSTSGGKSDTSKSDTSKSDTSKSDTSKSDTSKSDTSKSDTGKSDTGKSDTGKSDTGKKESSKPYDSYGSGGSGPSSISGTKIEDRKNMRRDRDEDGGSGNKPCKPGSQPVPGENCTREQPHAEPSAGDRRVGLPYDTRPDNDPYDHRDTDRFRDNSGVGDRTFNPLDKMPFTNPDPK